MKHGEIIIELNTKKDKITSRCHLKCSIVSTSLPIANLLLHINENLKMRILYLLLCDDTIQYGIALTNI